MPRTPTGSTWPLNGASPAPASCHISRPQILRSRWPSTSLESVVKKQPPLKEKNRAHQMQECSKLVWKLGADNVNCFGRDHLKGAFFGKSIFSSEPGATKTQRRDCSCLTDDGTHTPWGGFSFPCLQPHTHVESGGVQGLRKPGCVPQLLTSL